MNPTFVLLGCEKGLAKNICEKIARVPTVTDVKCVEGVYDMVIRLDSHSFDEIKKAIIERIRTMDGVQTCITLQGARSFDSIKRLWNK
jgi:DNA-binding Lrp family transcriptional regulator